MSKDDMRVVIYKILRYLYECNKKAVQPCMEDICHHCKLFSIPESYWNQIMTELIEAGYVKGFAILKTKDGEKIQMVGNATITLHGVDYLEENGSMQKAKEHLGEAFEIVLSSIISVLV